MNRVRSALSIPMGGVLAEKVLLAVFFFMGTVLGAYVVIPLPFTPVPVTLQTLFVLLGAAWLGTGWSAGVQALYLSAGALGAAVFAGAASGLLLLSGPTAGYLWAFLPASLLVASLWPKAASSLSRRVTLFAAADLLILLAGTTWLALLLQLGPSKALLMGLVPFLPGEVVKVGCAAAFAPRSR